MNREAAVLGMPACTVFTGELPAVARSLIRMGKLHAIRSVSDLDRSRLEKKAARAALRRPELCGEIVEQRTAYK